jgi:redox-sensing transcriptional repressor
VQRLPLYLRCLVQAQSQRMTVVNSVVIAELAGTNAPQVRKDLSFLGEFGVRGIGYDVDELIAHLVRWLGLRESRHVAIVGYGRLGSSLAGYDEFPDRGVEVRGVFDADMDKIGRQVRNGLAVQPMSELPEVVRRERIDIAVLAVPTDVVQEVAEQVIAAGVKALLNFAPVRLTLPDDVVVRQADVAGELQILSYHLNLGLPAEGVDRAASSEGAAGEGATGGGSVAATAADTSAPPSPEEPT